jgi:hypothetical protein
MSNLSKEYDRLYLKASKIINKYKPCLITNGNCVAGQPCCRGCKHLGECGCTVESLICKLYLCCEARDENPKCNTLLRGVLNEASEIGLMNKWIYDNPFRASKEEHFEHFVRRVK